MSAAALTINILFHFLLKIPAFRICAMPDAIYSRPLGNFDEHIGLHHKERTTRRQCDVTTPASPAAYVIASRLFADDEMSVERREIHHAHAITTRLTMKKCDPHADHFKLLKQHAPIPAFITFSASLAYRIV